MPEPRNPISLIVLDIDGVVSDGEASPLDLGFLSQLASFNAARPNRESLPAVTLCTGRPAPYVEVMLQAIGGRLPGVFENGAGLYLPEGYQFLAHPSLAENDVEMSEVRQRLEAELVMTGKAFIQPGKIHTLTLFAQPPIRTDQLQELTTRALGTLAERVQLVYSTSCLNILPRGVDKGKGIEFLADQTGIDPENMLGVGDSDVDLPFLSLVGHSAAPANAVAKVKSVVEFVSRYPTSQGVLDILRQFEVLT